LQGDLTHDILKKYLAMGFVFTTNERVGSLEGSKEIDGMKYEIILCF
jgi:hypothetical protein